MKMKEEFLEVSKKLNLKTNIEIKELEDFIFFLGIFQNFFSNKKLLKFATSSINNDSIRFQAL